MDKANTLMKWIATAILIVGTAVNGLGLYPLGPALLVLGGLVWLIVAVRVRDWPLIVTNLVMSLVGAGAIGYTLYCQNLEDRAFQAQGQAWELRQQLNAPE